MTTAVGLAMLGFNSRLALGGCSINIGGETLDCDVAVVKGRPGEAVYVVTEKESGRELCTFSPWHVNTLPSPMMFAIECAHRGVADATLIVPLLANAEEDLSDSVFDRM